MKLTLDTNCIIDRFDPRRSVEPAGLAVKELLNYAKAGRVDIAVTTRAQTDINQDKNPRRKERYKCILGKFPMISSIGQFDESRWDEDFYATEESEELIQEIRRIVFPSLSKENRKFWNSTRDIYHLAAHAIAGRDVFVTSEKHIHIQTDRLKKLGIVAMSPENCLKFFEENEAG